MSFDDVRKSWQSEVTRPASSAELQQLLVAAQQRYSDLERKIHWRDVREILAGILVVAGFAAGWPIYGSSAVACLGVAVIMLSTPVIVYVLVSANKPRSTPFTTSVLECSRQRLAWLDRQIRLLQSVLWWYVAPLITGCMLVAWGLTPGRWLAFGGLAFGYFLVAVVTVWLNRRAVRDDLMPAHNELSALIEALEPNNGK